MRKVLFALSMACLLSLSACGEKEKPPATLKDAVKDAKDAAKDGTKQVKEAVDEAKKK